MRAIVSALKGELIMTFIIGSSKTFLNEHDASALEFISIVADITKEPEYQKLKNYTHHHATTRYQHCLNVAWYTYIWCKASGLDYISAARGAMLHDFFVYDWRSEQPIKGRHSAVHPKIALENAKKYFEVNEVMEDVIINHMWPNTIRPPRTPEGMVITVADKYCATLEWSKHASIKTYRSIFNFAR